MLLTSSKQTNLENRHRPTKTLAYVEILTKLRTALTTDCYCCHVTTWKLKE